MRPKHTQVGNVVAAVAMLVVGLCIGAALYGGLDGLQAWQGVIGAGIAVVAASVAWWNAMLVIANTRSLEEQKRASEAKDLTQIIFAELVHMVVRCCFDSEAPWREYWVNRPPTKARKKFDVQKFAPATPVVYLATAPKLALLGEEPSQAIIEFYYRVAALRRDIEDIVRGTSHENIAGPNLEIVAFRFCLTLRPGLEAIQILKPLVQHPDQIIARVLATFDETRKRKEPGTLEERIQRLLNSAPDEWVRIDQSMQN
jgi:hypothetical protein